MPEFTFRQNTANAGIDTNRPSTEVAWSLCNNVKFQPGYAFKDTGRTLLATAPGPVRGLYTFKGDDSSTNTIVAGDNIVYRYRNNFVTAQNITPLSPPTSTYQDAWRFALNGGLPIISNGRDAIWKWPNFGSVLAPLSGAPSYAKSLITFDERVIIGNYLENGYEWQSSIGWTEKYKPENWARGVKVNELSRRKGFVPPNSGNVAHDFIRDFGVTGTKLIIYGTENIYHAAASAEDINFVFGVFATGVSVVGKRLSVFADGANYFIGSGPDLGNNGQMDVYRLTDNGLESIGFNIRNLLFFDLNWAAIDTGFAYRIPGLREIHFCVPTGTSNQPNKDYIYQEETKAWSVADCDYNAYSRTVDATGGTYDSLSTYGAYDGLSPETYDTLTQSGVGLGYGVVGQESGKILKLASGFNNNGAAIDAFLDTGDFHFGVPNERKILMAIMPFFRGQSTKSVVQFQVAYRNELHHPIVWSEKFDYVIGVDEKLYVRGVNNQGKYVRIRISSNQLDTPWQLEGYTLFYEFGGDR